MSEQKYTVAKLNEGEMLARWGLTSLPANYQPPRTRGRLSFEEDDGARVHLAVTDIDEGRLIRVAVPMTIEQAEELCVALAEHIMYAKGEGDG